MSLTFDQLAPRTALARIAADFHRRGWMAGTAGNLSTRGPQGDGDDAFWITASGQPKGQLDDDDFLLVRVKDREVIERRNPLARPSAETSIHQTIYQLFPEAQACFHVHSVDACVVQPVDHPQLRLPAIEMIKGLDRWEENPQVDIAIFDNLHDVEAIASAIEQRFRHSEPMVSALLIRGHGVTVWGRTLQETYNRVEIIEYIFSFMARRQ